MATTKKKQAVLFSNKDSAPESSIPKLHTKHSKLRPEHLVKLEPLTQNQEKLFELFNKTDNHLFLYGYAGTGKTTVSLYLALRSIILERRYSKIVVVRSTVSSREMGFLPGTKEEKEEVYKTPYNEIFRDLIVTEIPLPTEKLEEQKLFEFKSSSFVRGTTIKDSIILIDEFQNMNTQEILTVLTRAGQNSRVIICGDGNQDDLNVNGSNKLDKSCFRDIVKLTQAMGCFSSIKFKQEDIVRSDFVKELIICATKLGIME